MDGESHEQHKSFSGDPQQNNIDLLKIFKLVFFIRNIL